MLFDFDECRRILLKSLLAAIDSSADKIRDLTTPKRTSKKVAANASIDGISYCILPWHEMVALSFRLNTDHEANSEYRYSIADWKHYALLANEKAFNQAREYASRVYAAASSPGRARENAHLIYHAAAEALLNPRVARRLVALDIYAPTYGKPDFPAGTFEYVVVDEDKAFRANYCDIVLAQRLTQRLLEKRANRTKKRTKNTRR